MAIALLSVPALRLCHGRLGSNFTALGTVAGVGTRPRIGGTEESAQARRGGIWRTRGSLRSDEIKMGLPGSEYRPRPRFLMR